MRQPIALVFLSLIAFGLWEAAAASPVTNEDIRGTIQSLIYSYNQLDNKLERHEHRERALGELMKKAMQALQKGQKSLEPINGIFARLDDRVSQIETMLITQEEKYNAQSDKFSQALEHMFKWMRENDECFKHPPGSAQLVAAPAAPALPNEFVQQQQQMNKQLLDQMAQLSTKVGQLLDASQQSATQTQQGFERLPKAEELLSQIEAKLQQHAAAHAATAAPPAADSGPEFEAEVLERLVSLNRDVEQLRSTPQAAPVPAGLSEKDRVYIQELSNETLNALAALKSETAAAQQTASTKAMERLQQTEANLQGDIKQLAGDVSSSRLVLDQFYSEVNTSYSKLNNGFEVLGKFNNIMLTNSDVVLDTQRKVEFGTLQVVQKVSQLVEQQLSELTSLLTARFSEVDANIVSTQQAANRNISDLVDTALGQVWRRIQIMTGEITDNTELLRLMQSGHDGVVNSTFSTMLNLSGKVAETKGFMIDMDTNLNFLLGKLSLMSSEFANIKKGLAESLEDLRNSFHLLQERMPTGADVPHHGDKHQYLTDVNLLAKRHAEEQ